MLDHDQEKLLKETYELARANNKMLKKMRRHAIVGGIGKIIFWAVALGVPVWLYFTFFQPVLAELMQAVGQLQQVGGQLQEIGGNATNQFGELQNLFNKLPGIGQ